MKLHFFCSVHVRVARGYNLRLVLLYVVQCKCSIVHLFIIFVTIMSIYFRWCSSRSSFGRNSFVNPHKQTRFGGVLTHVVSAVWPAQHVNQVLYKIPACDVCIAEILLHVEFIFCRIVELTSGEVHKFAKNERDQISMFCNTERTGLSLYRCKSSF